MTLPPKSPEAAAMEEWLSKLIHHPDGTITNPDGIDDPEFFESLEEIRRLWREAPIRDPFAEL
jgi:hypothetical protein